MRMSASRFTVCVLCEYVNTWSTEQNHVSRPKHTQRETSLRPRLRLRLRLGLEIGQVESKPREQRGQQESSDHENNHKTWLDIQYTVYIYSMLVYPREVTMRFRSLK